MTYELNSPKMRKTLEPETKDQIIDVCILAVFECNKRSKALKRAYFGWAFTIAAWIITLIMMRSIK